MVVLPALGFVGKMFVTQLVVAATTSIVETGGQITQRALMEKFNEWGVDTSDNSALGQFMSNFKDNLSAGVQMAVMTQSMALTQALVDPLEDSYNSQLQTARGNLTTEIEKAKNKVAKNKLNLMAKSRLNKLYEVKDKNMRNTMDVVNTGTRFGSGFSQGASGMEQAYNSKNLENINLQGMDIKELVKVVNQLSVLQKIG